MFKVIECEDVEIIKEIFREYSGTKGAESCFVSFEKELSDLNGYYKGGALLLGLEDDTPVGSVAIRKIDKDYCEGKRLYIRPEYRGKGYAKIMLNSMIDKAKELGFREVRFTTKPDVMKVAYAWYKRLGYEELGCSNGVVQMKINLQ